MPPRLRAPAMGDVLATITREPPPRHLYDATTAPLPRTAVELRRERARAALTATIPLLLFALVVVVRVWALDLVPFGARQAGALAAARDASAQAGIGGRLSGSGLLSPLAVVYPLLGLLPSPPEAWIAARAVLDGAAGVLVYVTARSLAGTGVGVVVALVYGLSPWAWALSRDPAVASLPVLSAAAMLAATRAVRAPSPTWGILVGLLTGLQVRVDPIGGAILAAMIAALVVARVGGVVLGATVPGLALTAGPVLWAWLSPRPSTGWPTVFAGPRGQDVTLPVRLVGDLVAGIGVDRRLVGVSDPFAALGALAPYILGGVAVLLAVGAWRVFELMRGGRREAVIPLAWAGIPVLVLLAVGTPLRHELLSPLLPSLAVLAALAGAPVGRWSTRVRPFAVALSAALAVLGGVTIAGLLWSATAVDRMRAVVPYAEWAATRRLVADGADSDPMDGPAASLRFWRAVADRVRDAVERTGQREVAVLGGTASGAAISALTSLLGADVAVRPLARDSVVLPVEREAVYLLLPGQEAPPELAWPSARLGSVPLPPTDTAARIVTLRPRPVAHWLALHPGGKEIRFADGTVLLAARVRPGPTGERHAELVWLTGPPAQTDTGSGAAHALVTERIQGSAAREHRAALPESPATRGPELVVQRVQLSLTDSGQPASVEVRLVSGAGRPIVPADDGGASDGGVEIFGAR